MNKLIILVIVVLFFVFAYMYHQKIKNSNICEKDKMIKILTRQAARWSIASEQDNNALISLLHANYGAAYLFALKDVFTDKEIEDVMDIDITKFIDEIIEIQDKATLKIIKECPPYLNNKNYLAKIAKEGI